MDEKQQEELRLKCVELTIKLFEGKSLVKTEFQNIYVNIYQFILHGKIDNKELH
jgi:hypothetical protein